MVTKKRKPKYVAFVASSIDGRIAKNERSGTDWTSKEDWNFFQKSLSKMDAVVVGYNTYKVAEKGLKKRNTVVLTSRVAHLTCKGSVTFFDPKKSDLKRFLESKSYKTIGIVGGGGVYAYCLQNEMLNELFVTIEPYIFIAGVPMFIGEAFKKYNFRLRSVKKLNKKGTLLLQYFHAS